MIISQSRRISDSNEKGNLKNNTSYSKQIKYFLSFLLFSMITICAQFIPLADATAPCNRSHPGILINGGMFYHNSKGIFFKGEWDSMEPCSFAYNSEWMVFNHSKLPENAKISKPRPIFKYEPNYRSKKHQIIVDLQKKQVNKNEQIFSLKGDLPERFIKENINKEFKLYFYSNLLNLELKNNNENITIISTEENGRGEFDYWILLFFNSSKQCQFIPVDYGLLIAACSDSKWIYLGLADDDPAEGCESLRSQGIIKYNLESAKWEFLDKKYAKLFEYPVVDMAYWNKKVFIATRKGICVNDGGDKWIEYEINAYPKKDIKFNPRFFMGNRKKNEDAPYEITSGEIDIGLMKLQSGVNILGTAALPNQPKNYFYCINQSVKLYWSYDPEILEPLENYTLFYNGGLYYEKSLRYNHDPGSISQMTFRGGCDKSSPVYKLCLGYENRDFDIPLEYLSSGCYKAKIPFCWVPSSFFKVKLERH